MARLSEEKNRKLRQASLLQDRMKAEALEAGEITLEDATGMASRKEQRAVNRAVKKAYREEVREEKAAQRAARAKKGSGKTAAGKTAGSIDRRANSKDSGRKAEKRNNTRAEGGRTRAGSEEDSRFFSRNGGDSSARGKTGESGTRNRSGENSRTQARPGEGGRGKNRSDSRSRKDSRGKGRPSEAAPVRKKRKHVFLKILFSLLLLFAVLVAGIFIYFNIIAGSIQYVPAQTPYARPADVLREDGVTNILLIGTDGRTGELNDTRSDAMMLVSVNRNKKRLVMTSFLRDSYVNIPGVGQTRLNEAFFHGGPGLLIQTIEENYQIGIDYYVHVDFFTFVDVIDAFGGVTVEIQQPELQYVNGYIAEYDRLIGAPERDGFLPEPDGFGVRNLTGRQALGYSRIRYIGTDFGRTDRQRTVLSALINKAKHSSPFTILKAVGVAVPQLMTDIPRKTLVNLMMGVPVYAFYDTVQGRCPADGTWSNALMNGNQEVLAVDFAANRAYLKSLIYD